MNISDFFSSYLLELYNQLNSSNTHLTIFAATLGAVLGVLLTVFVGWISNSLKTLSYNTIARQQLRHLTEDNIMRCNANLGLLRNELANLKIGSGRFTLNGLSNLLDYPPMLLHSPAKFRSADLYLLRMQSSALNSHHAQLVNIVKLRENLSIEIRKAPEVSLEWELVDLRLGYDSLLQTKYAEIAQYTQTLQDYLDVSCFKRFILNFTRISKLEAQRTKACQSSIQVSP